MYRTLPILLAALVAAACTPGPVIGVYPQVVKKEVRTNYYPQAVALFASAGGPTEVYSSPADGASPEAVVAGLDVPQFVVSNGLTAVEPGGGGLRLILVFAPQTTALPDRICAGDAKGGTASAPTKVLAVFCRGGRAMSQATLFAEGAPGAGDPGLSKALNLLIASAMPARDPNKDSGERRRVGAP